METIQKKDRTERDEGHGVPNSIYCRERCNDSFLATSDAKRATGVVSDEPSAGGPNRALPALLPTTLADGDSRFFEGTEYEDLATCLNATFAWSEFGKKHSVTGELFGFSRTVEFRGGKDAAWLTLYGLAVVLRRCVAQEINDASHALRVLDAAIDTAETPF